MGCIHCGKNPYYTDSQLVARNEKVSSREIIFSHNNQMITARVMKKDDAFFEIIEGKYKGNLVHRWDIMSYL